MALVNSIASQEKTGYAYKIISSGQVRPYGESVKVVEVYLNEGLTNEEASDIVKGMGIGFNDSKNLEWYDEKLSYFKEKSPGVWEFKMVRPYLG